MFKDNSFILFHYLFYLLQNTRLSTLKCSILKIKKKKFFLKKKELKIITRIKNMQHLYDVVTNDESWFYHRQIGRKQSNASREAQVKA